MSIISRNSGFINSQSGDGPSPRSYHSAAGYADEHVFIFGGKSGADKIFNDLWILDLQKRKWSKHEFEENLELIEFNMSTKQWSILTRINKRSSLASEGLSLVSTMHGGKYYLVSFGGFYGSHFNNHIHVLRLKSLNCNKDGHTQTIERNHELSEAELNHWLDILFSPPDISDYSSESSEASVSSDLISEPDVSTNGEEETLLSVLSFGDTEGNKTSDISFENRSSIPQLPNESTEDNRPNGKESSDNELRNCNQEESEQQQLLPGVSTEGNKTYESEVTNGNTAQLANGNDNRDITSVGIGVSRLEQHSIAGENIDPKRDRSPSLNKQLLTSDVPVAKKLWLEGSRFGGMGSLDTNKRSELSRKESETNGNETYGSDAHFL